LGEDPIGFSSGDFNFYRYVGNSSVNFVDSLGLFINKSSTPVEIRDEDGKYHIIYPNKSFSEALDGFRVPAWDNDWMKVPNPVNDLCNINADGTPDVPWYVPEIYIPVHRVPGRKPVDYNWDRGGWL
jgi:uncharacterized protein RhaS with RHS repeats